MGTTCAPAPSNCPGGGQTTISGTVYAPSGTLPLYNVMVYVPSAPLEPLSAGATCACEVSGEPVAGVVDTVSTDYAAGFHDGILLCLERALAAGVLDLARAVRLVTANVADAVPGLAPGRGRLVPGSVADVVVSAREALSQVDTVIIGGEVVVERGRLVDRSAA